MTSLPGSAHTVPLQPVLMQLLVGVGVGFGSLAGVDFDPHANNRISSACFMRTL
jgi:hypothetical protein